MEYVWINDAPIRRIKKKNEFVSMVKRFKTIYYKNRINNEDVNDINWELRQLSTDGRIGTFEDHTFVKSNDYYVYEFGGEPIGLMILQRKQGSVEILELVTSPLSGNAGDQLVEFAVNQSANGVVTLVASGQQARSFYLYLGFKADGGSLLTLNPATSPTWEKVGNTWKRKKYKDSKVLHLKKLTPLEKLQRTLKRMLKKKG